ncbi:MAG: DUF4361 domain-containing protein [Porphyromonas sp.]|nr:DUF4361 domain-containing protein [Porphyromonas sp.]
MKRYRLHGSVASLLLVIVSGALFSSCNNYDFEQEFYKNEIGLLSMGEMMVNDRQVVNLNDEEHIVYIIGNLSGSQRVNKDMHFTVMADDSLFIRYNKTNYDVDETRFAHLLSPECYEMPEMSGVIKAGEGQGLIPIKLKNLDTLSPDSTYLLNFKIDESASDAVNRRKQSVLIKIFYENDFASTKVKSEYTYRNTEVAILAEGSSAARKLSSSVQLFPMGVSSVRMLAGDETYKDYKEALEDINAKSIVLEIGDMDPKDDSSRKVSIKPYKTIEVVQLPALPKYPNTYRLVEDKLPGGRSEYYKEFRIHYKYRTDPNAAWKEVKANFRQRVEKYADKL